jgi:hypothetical protein
MSHLTNRQHYVPDFYLRQWADSSGQITVHDLSEQRVFKCDPANVLAQRFFYEEDVANSDNRVEKILAAMEGDVPRRSASFRMLERWRLLSRIKRNRLAICKPS